MKVVVTGGAGYLGSHVSLALANAGYQAVLLDRFTDVSVLDRLARLTPRTITAERGDLMETAWVADMLDRHQPACVVHLAHEHGTRDPSADPMLQFGGNLKLLGSVLQAMEETRIKTLQVASSAAVYGPWHQPTISESSERRPVTRRGLFHHLVENLLARIQARDPAWRIAVLRHFNPAGAHPSGLLGEQVRHMESSSLLAELARATVVPCEPLQVCARQHPSPDGSPVLDLTHIQDVAKAHVAALETLLDYDESFSVNIGTGRGHSALELIKAFDTANACKAPWQFAAQRTAEVSWQVANTELALQLMGWRASHTLSEMCVHAMRWQRSLRHEQESLRR